MKTYHLARIRLAALAASFLILSVFIGQVVGYVFYRNQNTSVLDSVLNATLFQENSIDFESYLRILFSSLKVDNGDPDSLSVILCREGTIVGAAPRWIRASRTSSCETPMRKSLRRIEIRRTLPSSDVADSAIVHIEIPLWNRYAVSTTLLLWLIAAFLAIRANRLNFERRRISSMLGRLESALLFGDSPGWNATTSKFTGWSSQAEKFLVDRITSLKTSIEQAQKKFVEFESEVAVGKLARQAAHDIRAPLAVIDLVGDHLNQLPERERVLFRNAIQRFREIADELVFLGTKTDNATRPAVGVYSLQSLVAEIVSEKQAQFKSATQLQIRQNIEPSLFGKFVHLQSGLFKRVLSNVINNAVEAMQEKGRVTLSLSETISDPANKLILRVADNGPGIPEKILQRLGTEKISAGKKNGAGMGLKHANETLKSWNGALKITSLPESGTLVELEIPAAPSPSWFCSEIKIPSNRCVVILDDDPLIHSVWDQRFESLGAEDHDRIQPLHFSRGADLSRWLDDQSDGTKEALFLIDMELAGEAESGLDLIERYRLQNSAIVVTSRHEAPGLTERCAHQGCRLLPKLLVPVLPILPDSRPGLVKDVRSFKDCDAILVDDDEGIREVWSLYAGDAGKKLLTFSSAEDLLNVAEQLDRSVEIYLDSNLRAGLSGVEASEKLHQMGFNNVGLATGFESEQFHSIPSIKFVRDKRPPWTG